MITQDEVTRLLAVPKQRVNDEEYEFPMLSEILTIPLISADKRDEFLFDINRKGSIRLCKCTFQNRYRKSIILLRLDVGGPPHTNPEEVPEKMPMFEEFRGKDVGTAHLHIYVEGFQDKWAIPAPKSVFKNVDDLSQAAIDFMDYCKIVLPPIIRVGMFV